MSVYQKRKDKKHVTFCSCNMLSQKEIETALQPIKKYRYVSLSQEKRQKIRNILQLQYFVEKISPLRNRYNNPNLFCSKTFHLEIQADSECVSDFHITSFQVPLLNQKQQNSKNSNSKQGSFDTHQIKQIWLYVVQTYAFEKIQQIQPLKCKFLKS
eukprot:TRINITY_DN8517_c0_g1_i5.p3 TRINITY_DN8517_c0_g1~~TRINITY_DN8517_c0_g1_i5.p3  ORF type:complete len:156 (+),score=0.25 TRINITY_DN8517_c0_g1_i5:612-1079(+)